MKKLATIVVRILSVLSILLISNLVNGQILVSGTDFDPSSGNASRYYIGLDDIVQIGLQPGTIRSTPPLAPNANPNIFNVGYYYAITPTPIRLDSTRYQDYAATDYSYGYSPTATSPGGNVNILSYSLTGLVPSSAVSVIVDYCSAVKSTYAPCTGQRNQFKAGINLDQYNQVNGNDVTQIGMGQCASATITGTADASGNMEFRMNNTQFGSCQAMAIKKIQIMGTPQPQIFAAQGSEVCAGEQITLQSKLAYNATYQWQVNSGSGWTNIAGGTNAAQLYEVTNVQAYQFRLQITPLTGGPAITSSAISVNAITCCQVNGVAASRQTIYYDNFGRIDLTDKTGKSYFVWDYSNVLNPVEVAKTTTTPFRWPLVPAPLGATFQAGPGPLNDGDYCVAGYLTGYNPDNGYAGAMLQWANRTTGPTNPPDVSLDHSGQKDGACLFINCPPNTQGQSIYTRNITNLCFGKQLYFETWIAVFTNSAGGPYSGVDVTLRLTDGGNAANVVTANGTATRQADGGGIWVRIAGNINLVGTSLKMEIINNSTVSANGNDLVLDDIKIMACAPPTISLFFDLPTLSEAIDVCTIPISLQTKASALLKTYYNNAPLYLYQWTRTPNNNASWTNYGTPMSAETYAISNPQADPAFATLINGGKVYFRVVAGTALIFSTNNNFTAPNYANKNDPCKNYSVSDPTIVATVQCPSCTKPTAVVITGPATTPKNLCQGTAQTLSGTATVGAASINGGFTYSWIKTLPTLTVLNLPTVTALTIGTATAVPSNTTAITGAILEAGTYVLRVEDGSAGNSACYTEASVVVFVNATTVPGVIATAQTICTGDNPVAFTVTTAASGGDGTIYAYVWESDITTTGTYVAIAGATSATYDEGVLTNGSTTPKVINYRRKVTSGVCPQVTSNVITITVNPAVVAGVVAGDQTVCSGGDPAAFTQTTAPTGGSGTYTYVWQSSTTSTTTGFANIVPAATAATYDVPAGLTVTTYYRRVDGSLTCATANANAITVTVPATLVPGVVAADQTICYNTVPVTFTSTSAASGGNGTTYAYQWQTSTTLAGTYLDIATRTNATLTDATLLTTDKYYRRKVTSGVVATCNVAYSNIIHVTVSPIFVVGSIGSIQTICTGTTPTALTSVSLPTGGKTAYTYQWQFSPDNGTTAWANVASGGTGTGYAPGTLTTDMYYRRTDISAGGCGTLYTANVKITVDPVVTQATITADQAICSGATPSLIGGPVVAGGSTTASYVWEQSVSPFTAWTVIAGQTTKDYQPPALSAETWYRRTDKKGTCAGVVSTIVKITITSLAPATVTLSQTPAGTICAGTNVTFTASAGNGGTPTYEWFLNGSSQGAVSSAAGANTYSGSALVNGDIVKITIVSSLSCASPATASTQTTMVVTTKVTPTISITSNKTTICPSESVDFSIVSQTNQGGTPTYQWRKNGAITGATNTTYTASSITNGDVFDLVMTTSLTCVTATTATSTPSITITVTPTPTPSVSIVADKPVICSGQTVVFTATPVQGGLTPVYVWKNNGLVIAGETTASLSISTLGTPNSITVEMVSNAVCAPATPVASNAIVTTVNAGIGAGTIGNPQTICYNSIPATINQLTAATGVTAAATYTWEASLNGVTGWGVIPGATNTSYTPPVAITADVYVRRVVLDGSLPAPCNTATTPSVRITVRPILVAGVIAADQIICSGVVPATITQTTAPTGGTQTFTYQWQSDAATIGVFVDISGATNSSYTSAAITRTTQFQRTEISGGSCGSITSNIVTKTVTAPETVTAVIDNAPAQVCASAASIVFTATGSSTTGTGTLSYQWYLGSVSATNAVGTNSSTYTYAPVSTNDNGKQVNLVVTTSNGCNSGPGTAMPYVLDIVGSITPTISISVNHNPNCAGIPTTFTATSTGGGSGATYQWYLVPFATGTPQGVGTGGTTYTSSALADRDSVYVEMTSSSTCLAAGLSNPFQSNKIRMQIKLIPAPSIVEGDQTVCSPIPGSFTFHGSVRPGNTYQWKLNNVAITGATNADYTATQSGTYTLNEDNGICNSTSAPVVLTVIQTPVANAGADIYMKEGDLGNLNGSGGAVYSWSPSTYLSSAVVSNPNFQATQTITYTLTVSAPSNPLCFTTANVTVFVVKPIKVPNVITVNGDGVNDDWVIENIEGYPNVIIEIYNRWGNLVWKSQGYPKNWDGTNFRNGQVLPDGTYFYIINLQSQVYNEPLTGWVQIIK